MGQGFSEGLWSVCKNGLWGFVDRADNVVVDFQYLETRPFQDGVAFVQTSTDMWGLIDRQGQYIIEPSQLDLSSFYLWRGRISDLIAFKSGNKWGFMNISGDIQIPAIYDSASDFSDGLACVRNGDLWGYIDTKNNWILTSRFGWAAPFYRGYAAFKSDEGLWGLMDIQGNVVLDAKYERLYRDVQGLTGMCVDGKWGFMDDTFHLVVEPRYHSFRGSSPLIFYVGGIVFLEDREELKGIALDIIHGNEAFTFSINAMGVPVLRSAEGYYVLQSPRMEGNRRPELLVDKEGKVVLSPIFDSLIPSKEGVVQVGQNDLYGLVVLNR
jgi:hypothetical protein